MLALDDDSQKRKTVYMEAAYLNSLDSNLFCFSLFSLHKHTKI